MPYRLTLEDSDVAALEALRRSRGAKSIAAMVRELVRDATGRRNTTDARPTLEARVAALEAAVAQWPGIRPLTGIVDAPGLTPDGALVLPKT